MRKKYPFSPEILDAMPAELVEHYRLLEEELLTDICAQFKLGDISVQDLKALRSHGISLNEIKKRIRERTGASNAKVNALFEDIERRSQEYYGEVAKAADITAPEHIVAAADIAAIKKQTLGAFDNITGSLAFTVRSGGKQIKLPLQKAYTWALDQAIVRVESGTVSYDEAIAGAVKELADSGINTVEYESGRAVSVDAAVRRAVMTGISQLSDKYTEQSMEFLGTEYCEVSAHAGARDKPGPSPWSSHKDWQGKVYWCGTGVDPLGKYPNLYDYTGFGEVDGLEGINCRHRRFPWIEGVSERTYTDYQLAHIDDGLGCEYQGREYSAYEATQRQRQLEGSIRRAKREKAAYAAAGLEEKTREANIRLRRLNKEYRQFSKAAGLPEQASRVSVYSTANKAANISDSAIERLRGVKSETLGEEISAHVNDAMKETLRLAKSSGKSTVEAGVVMDLKSGAIVDSKIGDVDASISMPFHQYDFGYVFIHNHPDSATFSADDVLNFFKHEFEMAVFAVGNNGSIYGLAKTLYFDAVEAKKLFDAFLPKLEAAVKAGNKDRYVKLMMEFLRKSNSVGLEFISHIAF